MTDYRGGRSQQIFYINSKNRLAGTDSDWTSSVDIRGLDDPNMVKILHIYIPKSYYSVAEPYNTFILQEDAKQTTIKLTPGNYSIISLKAKLSSLLSADKSTITINNKSFDRKHTITQPGEKHANIQPTFASTIHCAQGQTHPVWINTEGINMGLLYVALSRAESLNDVQISKKF